ncbi:phage SPO1 DNA polymerase-related protein [Thalassoporum mexicanum PCC 7367]|uniref:uracil-DNA glycosylase n=1 Tax=Thalassoporum mexicanum TaxID=3457544 RepID=UPI00029FA48B|nr:uracil-DNA glycosylase [Pseudanabaena sp. PCC 7367]AFY71363.1 phage SPO1 DNA polymerase-related protein [Pseudanabaena sp. PCC 7367]
MSDPEQISLFNLGDDQESPPKTTTDTAKSSSTAIYANLEELRQEASGCQKCGLAETRNKVVVDRGNPKALIMIIGEGPGEEEDKTGLPFVGRAGQLLDKIIASVDLDREQDIYVCNVVKCRPPGNRNPTPDEMAACKPYLLEQIRLIDPKIILLTGATAVKAVLGDKTGITKLRGKWRDWEGRLVMPILHPAYLLRNPRREEGSPKWLMWQDIKAIKAKLLEFKAELANGNGDQDDDDF